MLFMGEEWNAPRAFPYFCDFEPELATKVREGRKREFAHFERFRDPAHAARFPIRPACDHRSQRAWTGAGSSTARHEEWLDLYQRLLTIRQLDIVPLIPEIRFGACIKLEAGALSQSTGHWRKAPCCISSPTWPTSRRGLVGRTAGRMIYATHPNIRRR